jgi:heavy metal sensor kinase
MRGPKTIRGRLTFWFAGAIALVLLVFAGVVFLLVRAALIGEVRTLLHQDLATTAAFVRDNPGDVAELAEFKADALVLVLRGQEVELRSGPWERMGLPGVGQITTAALDWPWESPPDHHYRIAAQTVPTAERTFVVAVAADEEPVQRALATLAWTLGLSLPILIGLSVLGGSILAGRMLAPVRRMAAAAERIGGERLGERLPVENPGDELGRLAIVTNQSLDRLREAMERQRRFTADASHEMRTPLTAIRSAGEVALRRAPSPAEDRETIGSMLEGVGQLTRLIDRLLLLARADAGTLPVTLERFDASQAAREVADLLQPVADQRAVVIETAVSPRLPVTADKVLLRHAVLNILDNAIKHSPAGGSVHVTSALHNGSVSISVRDSGPGIAPEHRKKVFERFYRVDLSRGRGAMEGGAGLGLAIARWAVESSGGWIELQSEPGAGSTFTIVLPVDRASAAPDHQGTHFGGQP